MSGKDFDKHVFVFGAGEAEGNTTMQIWAQDSEIFEIRY